MPVSEPSDTPVGRPREERGSSRLLARVAFFAYLMFMLAITLFIFPTVDPPHNFVPFRTIIRDCTAGIPRQFIVNFLGNIIAFIPIGALYPKVRGRGHWSGEALLFAAGFTLLIEASQLLSMRRVADVDDLILNTLGGALGMLLAQRVRCLQP